MNSNYTHIAMVIDRSGSMSWGWSDVVGGYKTTVEEQKAEKGKCTFTVAAFDTEYELVEDFTDIQKVSPDLKVLPRGGTALLDAVGKTIVAVGERLAALDEKQRPAKVVFYVQTDGQENASKEFTKDAIKKLIEIQTKVFNWQFMFLGADLSSVNEAVSWGIQLGATSVYNASNNTATYDVMNSKLKTMRSMAFDPNDIQASYDSMVCATVFTDEEKEALNESKK